MSKFREVLSLTFKVLNYASLIALSYKTWRYLYDTCREEKQHYEEEILHNKRHNCVVTFSKGKGHNGWPGFQRTHLNIDNVKSVYEPFLYFIKTAKYSLDVAIMSINVKCIIDALIIAHNRGVKVRVISNFYMNRISLQYYKEMAQKGIPIMFYVSKEMSNSIMHTKYIVKDFSHKPTGYLLAGSFNLTNISFSNNYEDVVFTTQRKMVEDFNENFATLWDRFEEDNNLSTFNGLVLDNAGFGQVR